MRFGIRGALVRGAAAESHHEVENGGEDAESEKQRDRGEEIIEMIHAIRDRGGGRGMNGDGGSGDGGGRVGETRLHETRDHQFLSEPLVPLCDCGGRVNVYACFFMLFYAAGRSARRGTESTSRLLELVPSAHRRPG